MTDDEIRQIARDVLDGKSRSYVSASVRLAEYVIERLGADPDPAPAALGDNDGEGT